MEGGQAAYLQIPVMPNCFSEEVFNRWPELYAKQQGIVLESGTGQALVNLALGRGVDQFVIWDPNLPATINVATTLAWLRGTAAFSPDDAVGPLAENLHLALDLRTLGLHNWQTPTAGCLVRSKTRAHRHWLWFRWGTCRATQQRAS